MRAIAAIVLWLLTACWAPQAAAGDFWPDRIESVLPVAPDSNVYRASFMVQDGTSPIFIDNTLVRIDGGTIDLVAYVTIGPFSVPGFAPGTATLGALPPRTYTLRFYTAINDGLGKGFGPEVLQDTVQFTVAAGNINGIPTMHSAGLMLLGALMLLLATRRTSTVDLQG